ncbi:hypothetical protein PBY51_001449 [Eleginops maclovinus]|uniref:EF-hand domain-containing protein n=1 Tax=Eleginops maclovinus TaxID=56733 RepID=A0AAN7WXJ9_ELEMC|nr:hypothetical protein PBY51_001449 [Eleginops maclovinus]
MAFVSILLQAMGKLQCIFDKYAGVDGDKSTMTKKELAELLRNELGEVDPKQVENILAELDKDNSGTVSFAEFTVIAVQLFKDISDCLQE